MFYFEDCISAKGNLKRYRLRKTLRKITPVNFCTMTILKNSLVYLMTQKRIHDEHCVKIFRIRSYSGPHFSTFGLNAER